jgi:hypothetical protein
MDPYLEGSAWDSFHAQFIDEMGRQLMERLRPKYFVRVERRFVQSASEELEVTATDVRPDVAVSRRGEPVGRGSKGTLASGVAILDEPPLSLDTIIPQDVPQRSLLIRDAAKRRLVTAIELLSPSNKRSPGRRKYLRRRNKFLASSAHLVEIALLRRGLRPPMRGELPADAAYFAFVSRVESRPSTGIWPMSLRQALRPIPIPLLRGDTDVSLDLQGAFTLTYDTWDYAADLDYSKPPEIALSPEDAAWAGQVLAGHAS